MKPHSFIEERKLLAYFLLLIAYEQYVTILSRRFLIVIAEPLDTFGGQKESPLL